MTVVGVDACRGKWLAIALDEERFVAARLGAGVAALLTAWPDAAAVGIDIPIGLPQLPWREADRAARDFVGERRSSVFATFPRLVLESGSYDEARALCVERGWPQPSIQSYGMRHRILELAREASADERLIEVHPEVSFRELLGRPLSAKRTATGAAERRSALAQVGIDVPDLPYPLADVLDAAVAAWSAARCARGEARPLPAGHSSRIGAIWR